MDADLKQKLIEIEKERARLYRREFIYDMICIFSITFTAVHAADFIASFF